MKEAIYSYTVAEELDNEAIKVWKITALKLFTWQMKRCKHVDLVKRKPGPSWPTTLGRCQNKLIEEAVK